MVGVSSPTAPHSNGDAATVRTRFSCQHIAVGATGDVLQAGEEVTDGAVAVSPADKFTQTVRGGLNQAGHHRMSETESEKTVLETL